MRSIIIGLFLIFGISISYGQDLISGGTNSWIFHTPDDTRSNLYIAPQINGNWAWDKQTMFLNDGTVLFSGNVGIGTRTPAAKLDVNGPVVFNNTNSNHSSLRFGRETNDMIIADNSSNNLYGGGYFFRVHNNDLGHKYIDAMMLASNGNIGIGTRTPAAKLDVNGPVVFNNTNSNHSSVRFGRETNDMIIADNSSNNLYGGGYFFRVHNNDIGHKYIDAMMLASNGNVGIGTRTPGSKLAVNGKIHAKEVKVDLIGWPDYVFKENYTLPTLQQIEQHIQQKGHLINIPSATEVEKNGIELGKMNKLLLEKIEELTLYTIDQEKQLKEQKHTIQQLKEENKSLKIIQQRLTKIESVINRL